LEEDATARSNLYRISLHERAAIIGYQQIRKSLHLDPNPNDIKQRKHSHHERSGKRQRQLSRASSDAPCALAKAHISAIQNTHTCLICCQGADPVASRRRLNWA